MLLKNKRILFFCLLLIISITIFFSFRNDTQEIYVDVSSREQYINNIRQSHSAKNDIVNDIFINGIPLVYCKDYNVYFFTIPIGSANVLKKMNIEIKADEDVNFTVSDTNYFQKSVYSVSADDDLQLIVYNSRYYDIVNIRFTYLPIINISVDKSISEKKINSKIGVYDPNYIENNGKFYSSFNSKIKIRGSLSTYYPKKSYKITLDNYGSDNLSLLGFTSNNEWILDSLYSDPSKMRNMLSSELWNDLSGKDSQRLLKTCYVEVFINGSYRGLYSFKEQINENSYNLNNKILIKGNGYNKMAFSSYVIGNIFSEQYINFEMKYPDSKDNSFCFWYPILNKMKNYYTVRDANDFIMSSSFYFDNISNYKLLLAFTKALDNNSSKNIYVEYDLLRDKLIFIPWDLDQTFGMSWTNTNDDTYMMYEFDKYNELTANVYELYAPLFNIQLNKKYWMLRKTVLNSTSVNMYLDYYKNLLVKSGAVARDSNRWYNYDLEYEVENIKEWTNNRILFLDNYFSYK